MTHLRWFDAGSVVDSQVQFAVAPFSRRPCTEVQSGEVREILLILPSASLTYDSGYVTAVWAFRWANSPRTKQKASMSWPAPIVSKFAPFETSFVYTFLEGRVWNKLDDAVKVDDLTRPMALVAMSDLAAMIVGLARAWRPTMVLRECDLARAAISRASAAPLPRGHSTKTDFFA